MKNLTTVELNTATGGIDYTYGEYPKQTEESVAFAVFGYAINVAKCVAEAHRCIRRVNDLMGTSIELETCLDAEKTCIVDASAALGDAFEEYIEK